MQGDKREKSVLIRYSKFGGAFRNDDTTKIVFHVRILSVDGTQFLYSAQLRSSF